nr:hypothetical protein [Tanacetum cinerariifolium]
MDDPNITMEEYIKLQAEKDQRQYPTIVYNDALTSNENVSSKPPVSIYNAIQADIDFSISFSDFDDEDYTFICDKNRFYKLILVNDLKLELINDHVKINTGLCLANVNIKPMDSVVRMNNNITPVEFDEHLETNHNKKENFQKQERLGKIYGRGVLRVQVFDFGGLTAEMAEGLSGRMLMKHMDAQGQSVFTSQAWRWLFETGSYRYFSQDTRDRIALIFLYFAQDLAGKKSTKLETKRDLFPFVIPRSKEKEGQQLACMLDSGIIEMEPDIKNMTFGEYREYKAKKERRLRDNVRSKNSPTRYKGAKFNSSHRDKSDSDFDEILDDLLILGAKNLRRMGQEKVQNGMMTWIKRRLMWKMMMMVTLIEDVEWIKQFFNVPDETNEVIQPLISQPIHITPPIDDYEALATKSILEDNILNVTMADKEADFNPTKDI